MSARRSQGLSIESDVAVTHGMRGGIPASLIFAFSRRQLNNFPLQSSFRLLAKRVRSLLMASRVAKKHGRNKRIPCFTRFHRDFHDLFVGHLRLHAYLDKANLGMT
jgi:hypothetical protein